MPRAAPWPQREGGARSDGPVITTDRLLGGRYRLLDTLGEGGMAVVHRAHDDMLDREVAVKVLRPAHASDPEFVSRFRREARHAAGLHDPRIVTIHDLGVDPATGADYIVMQLVDGPDLQTLLDRGGRLPMGQALRVGVEAAMALQVAHDHGIVHRDVKPGNILIDRAGAVRVADFGIARAAGDGAATTAGLIIGSPQYVSPEQVAGEPITPASDIYSLGVVLYELLTGGRPFEGPTPAVIALQRLREAPRPPSTIDPQIPDELDAIVMRAMARDPEDRYGSAADLAADLEGFRLREFGGVRRTGSHARAGLVGGAAGAGAATMDGEPEDAGAAEHWDEPALGALVSATASPNPSMEPRSPSVPARQMTGTLRRPIRPERPRLRRTPSPPPATGDERRRHRLPVAALLPLLALGLVLRVGAGMLLSSRDDPGTPVPSGAAPSDAGIAVQPSPSASPLVVIIPSLSPSVAPSASTSPTRSPIATPTPRPTARPTARPTPRPTVAPAPGATAPARDPAETVARFYALVVQERFDEAARLWSPRMRSQYPPEAYIDGRFEPTTGIDIRQLSIRSQSVANRTAVVYVDLIEYREDGAARRYVGTWDLVLSSSGWLMDEPHF